MKAFKRYQNYIIIALLSFISIFFLPMLGSEVGLGFNIPNTWAGWVVWIITKLLVMTINILLFDQFVKQGKVNSLEHPNYIAAKDILDKAENQEEDPLAPSDYLSRLYRRKGIILLITSALGVFGLTSAILTFDWVSMLSYLFTIVMGVIFGWITMNNVEDYWTDEYYRFALKHQAEIQKKDPNPETPHLSIDEHIQNIITLSEENNNGINT